jgi:hypothetical protein
MASVRSASRAASSAWAFQFFGKTLHCQSGFLMLEQPVGATLAQGWQRGIDIVLALGKLA